MEREGKGKGRQGAKDTTWFENDDVDFMNPEDNDDVDFMHPEDNDDVDFMFTEGV